MQRSCKAQRTHAQIVKENNGGRYIGDEDEDGNEDGNENERNKVWGIWGVRVKGLYLQNLPSALPYTEIP